LIFLKFYQNFYQNLILPKLSQKLPNFTKSKLIYQIWSHCPELCYEPCRNALRVNSRTKLAARLHDNSARILTRSELLLFHISLTLKVLTNQSIMLNSYSLRLVPRRADPILAGVHWMKFARIFFWGLRWNNLKLAHFMKVRPNILVFSNICPHLSACFSFSDGGISLPLTLVSYDCSLGMMIIKSICNLGIATCVWPLILWSQDSKFFSVQTPVKLRFKKISPTNTCKITAKTLFSDQYQ
jgi:hypothetical protein